MHLPPSVADNPFTFSRMNAVGFFLSMYCRIRQKINPPETSDTMGMSGSGSRGGSGSRLVVLVVAVE